MELQNGDGEKHMNTHIFVDMPRWDKIKHYNKNRYENAENWDEKGNKNQVTEVSR